MKTYDKPEVSMLGEAAVLIEGSKPVLGENGHAMQPNSLGDEQAD